MLNCDLISLLKPARALVIGDFMLDVYTKGSVQRISPEAPVPVLCVEEENSHPGGAGNAILNLVSLGMEVVAIGRVGNDLYGRELVAALEKERVDCNNIFLDNHFSTPVKKRMIADHQQLLRVDYENPTVLSAELERKVCTALPELLKRTDVVAISDYAKGFLSDELLYQVIHQARERKIPVIVDPKGINFRKYRGATILKPNLGEAFAAIGMERKCALDEVGRKILEEIEIDILMITRSKEGITLFSREEGRHDFPAFVHQVKDVTGAGDTVLAVITAAVVNQLDLKLGAVLANVAASIAIERIGCARISLSELSDRLLQIRLQQKIQV